MTGEVIPVILAGGTGTRLWPLSTPERPKQFLNLFGNQTMLQQAVARANDITPHAPIIVTQEKYHDIATKQLAGQNAEFLLEPAGRGTAIAIARAAYSALEQNADAVLFIMPADHFIGDEPVLQLAIHAALPAAAAGQLMTFGITPDYPATGYGYIARGDALQTQDCYQIKSFIEKPDAQRAQEYINAGYLWNSGMFLFRADVFLNELQRYAPQTAAAARVNDYDNAPNISVDYAVMEHTTRAGIIPCNPGWSDIGSWPALQTLGQTIALSGEVLRYLPKTLPNAA